MPKLLMYLLANDYGFLNKLTFLFALFFVIILIAFIVLIAKKFGCKRQTLFYINWYASVIITVISFLILSSNVILISPEDIPEHGTNAQKEKMVYCVRQYAINYGVALHDITREDISRIMEKCEEEDNSNKLRQENNLKNKQFQESLDSLEALDPIGLSEQTSSSTPKNTQHDHVHGDANSISKDPFTYDTY